MDSQNSLSSQLLQESTQYSGGSSSGDGERSDTELQAMESFATSLQHRLHVAQQSLRHKQRLLIEKGSLLRYTQKLLVETAADFAAGTDVSSGSAFAHNDQIARSGLRLLLQPSDHPDRLKFSEEARAQAAMAAAGFFPTGFAGLVVPKSSASSHGDVAVVSVSHHTVAGGGTSDGHALDLCLEVGVRNFSKHAVHDVSITVLPWRCAAGSMGPASAPSPEPLPSLSSGLRVLPAAGAGGTIQVVVGVSELLGFRDPHTHHDISYEHSRQRVLIGAPRARCVYCCYTVYLCSSDGHSSVILKEDCCQQELQRAEYCVSAPVGDVERQCVRSEICNR